MVKQTKAPIIMKALRILLLRRALCLLALNVHAAPGDLDASFGTGGKVTTPIGNGNLYGNSVVMQSDGKIVVAGHSDSDFALVRYNTNGSPDTNFGTGGRVT